MAPNQHPRKKQESTQRGSTVNSRLQRIKGEDDPEISTKAPKLREVFRDHEQVLRIKIENNKPQSTITQLDPNAAEFQLKASSSDETASSVVKTNPVLARLLEKPIKTATGSTADENAVPQYSILDKGSKIQHRLNSIRGYVQKEPAAIVVNRDMARQVFNKDYLTPQVTPEIEPTPEIPLPPVPKPVSVVTPLSLELDQSVMDSMAVNALSRLTPVQQSQLKAIGDLWGTDLFQINIDHFMSYWPLFDDTLDLTAVGSYLWSRGVLVALRSKVRIY